MGACSVAGCKGALLARSYCRRHYEQWRRHGDPEVRVMAERGAPLLWLRDHAADTGSDCLLWPFKSRYTNGYGAVFFNGSLTGAHRAMCRIAHGEPQPGTECAHSCGSRLCVNPRHLRWATPAQNAMDKRAHGTSSAGAANPQAKLTENDVRTIRRLARSCTREALAREYGVSRRAVGMIIRRDTWGHVV